MARETGEFPVALFGKADKEDRAERAAPASQARPVVGRKAHCHVCSGHQQFSRCWLRVTPIVQCSTCGLVFEDPAALYRRSLPACPRCGEYLEQPGFEYGLCDGCGSKHELVPGTKPSLLPNKAQRAAMDKLGKAWRSE